MRRVMFAAGCIALLIGAAAPSPVLSQESSRLFVVYGYLYYDSTHSVLVDGGYTIYVCNETKGETRSAPLGSGSDAGKFCTVFIAYLGESAVSEGDIISVSLHSPQSAAPAERETRYILSDIPYCVTADDVHAMKIMLELELQTIAVENCTWGIIKSLFTK